MGQRSVSGALGLALTLMGGGMTPIELPPNTATKGVVEFRVRDYHAVHLASGGTRVIEIEATERRSHQRKVLKVGECFDARIQKVYRGEIGRPYRKPRKAAKTGKPMRIYTHGKWD